MNLNKSKLRDDDRLIDENLESFLLLKFFHMFRREFNYMAALRDQLTQCSD